MQSLCFSHDEQLLASIGGQDDNNLTIWDIHTGKPICGAISPNLGLFVGFFNKTNNYVITAGKYLLRVWEIDYVKKKLEPTDCKLGQLKRIFTCLLLDPEDKYCYVGSTSGDLLCVQMQGPKNYKYSGPKRKISKGIMSVAFHPDGKHMVVGGGDGTLMLLDIDTLQERK